jgi:hypothetical protein
MDDNYQNLTDAEKELQITEELNWLLKFQLKNINYGDLINQYMDLNTPYLTSLVKKAEQQNTNSASNNTQNNKRKLSFEESKELSTKELSTSST